MFLHLYRQAWAKITVISRSNITQLPYSLRPTPLLSPGQQVDSFPLFPALVPRDSYDLNPALSIMRRSKSSRTSFSVSRLSANHRYTPKSTWRDLCLRLALLALWILEIWWRRWWDVEVQRISRLLSMSTDVMELARFAKPAGPANAASVGTSVITRVIWSPSGPPLLFHHNGNRLMKTVARPIWRKSRTMLVSSI